MKPWQDDRWTDSSVIGVIIDPDGSVTWPSGWNAVRKRSHLEDLRRKALELDPDADPNSGNLRFLEIDVRRAEHEEEAN